MNFRWGQALLSQLRQLSLQPYCAMCERPASDILCVDCFHQLKGCQISTALGIQDNDLSLLAWGHYSGFLKQVLAQLKYNQKPEIGQFLGQQLGMLWLAAQAHLPRPVVLPIPLHQRREKERGYNQATLIADGFCHVTGLMLIPKGLVRRRATQAQFNLTVQERFTNVADAFSLESTVLRQADQKPILLLDDIYTTGATIYSAAQTLRQSGLQVLGAVAVAKA